MELKRRSFCFVFLFFSMWCVVQKLNTKVNQNVNVNKTHKKKGEPVCFIWPPAEEEVLFPDTLGQGILVHLAKKKAWHTNLLMISQK